MHTVSITISNQYTQTNIEDETKVEVPQGGVIFSELSNAGYELASGCLAGSCGVCLAFIAENIENIKPASAVEQDTITHLEKRYLEVLGQKAPHPIRLMCRAKVIGDITIAPFVIKNGV